MASNHHHPLPICGDPPNAPHAPSCAKMRGAMIACGAHWKVKGKALCSHKTIAETKRKVLKKKR